MESPPRSLEPQPSRRPWPAYIVAIYDGRLAEIWFKVAEWVLVVAALQAAGVAAHSLTLRILAYISAGLVSLYAFDRADIASQNVDREIRTLPWLARILVGLLVSAVQYLIIISVNSAVQAALKAVLSPR